ncbi:hypothetical protein CEXT_410191 [Caerostris extrusa]|uniref:Uncharacterized protein n=1 Tax=Caerostris extrusa TaxID=172846 RepID=A0AAV4TLX9_CAEEX|nr:hypothetical protein CEXT_410191 [Caerostris extrusa]
MTAHSTSIIQNATAIVPRRIKEMFVDSPSLFTRGKFSLQQNEEVVYLGFDFPSELEVKKKKKRGLLGAFWKKKDF